MHLPAYLVLCLFAAILAVIRFWITGTTNLWGLIWNLILALLPYLFALWYVSDRYISRWLAMLLWILFLPNSFYILTDFVHLHKYPDMAYYDIVYISTMAFAGMVSGYASMEVVHKYWNIHCHKWRAWIYIVLIFTLSMVGVYLGRFLRFNSWDIFHDIGSLIYESWTVLSTNGSVWDISDETRATASGLYGVGAMGLWQFVLLYGAFFLIVYAFVYHSRKTK